MQGLKIPCFFSSSENRQKLTGFNRFLTKKTADLLGLIFFGPTFFFPAHMNFYFTASIGRLAQAMGPFVVENKYV
jgi:hypothetical protein